MFKERNTCIPIRTVWQLFLYVASRQVHTGNKHKQKLESFTTNTPVSSWENLVCDRVDKSTDKKMKHQGIKVLYSSVIFTWKLSTLKSSLLHFTKRWFELRKSVSYVSSALSALDTTKTPSSTSGKTVASLFCRGYFASSTKNLSTATS